MGRPLFSISHAPHVRVEPEPVYPVPEKWSYWKPFDPDADEFFENDDAVYEAFIDPTQLPLHDHGSEHSVAMVVENSSSSSSSSSSSGRGSPMDASEGISVEEIDLHLRQQATPAWLETGRAEDDEETRRHGTQGPPPPARSMLYETLEGSEEAARAHSPAMGTEYTNVYPIVSGSISSSSAHALHMREHRAQSFQFSDTFIGTRPRSVSPIPVPASPPPRVAPSSTQPATPVRPSTPPNQFSPFYGSPSPPPSVTPRLYSWSSHNPMASLPTSPSAAGPLTNRSARLSVTHISPALLSLPRPRILS
ncbi:hypothetical protein B0H21DRAFT_720123 [Amylocystis lapponica]|nr:hypothetical protein B0H21DRAFT_720123 [Amylocystis lapponica]